MNLFCIVVGTPTRRGRIINSIERYVQTEANYSQVWEYFDKAYRGFAVQVNTVETIEDLNIPKVVEKPKDIPEGERHVETIYKVGEINIGLTDEQKTLVKELTILEDQLRRKDEELINSLKEHWKDQWWLNHNYQKSFQRRGQDVYLKEARIKWDVMISEVTNKETT